MLNLSPSSASLSIHSVTHNRALSSLMTAYGRERTLNRRDTYI